MYQVLKLSDEEQLEIYMKLSKKKLAEMLLECNKHIDRLSGGLDPVSISNPTYTVTHIEVKESESKDGS
jgi:hypothetical protein